MSEENNATKNPQTEGPPKRRFVSREQPVTVMFDQDTLDDIEKARKYQRPSDGKMAGEPRSTFIYNIVKRHLERCPTCGGSMVVMKTCPDCDGDG